jgi:hypothetical protein
VWRYPPHKDLARAGAGVRLSRPCHVKRRPDAHDRHRVAAERIGHAVWLCHGFSLSFRNVDLLRAERGHHGQRRDHPLLKRPWAVNLTTPPALLSDPARGAVTPRLPPPGRFVRPEEAAALVAFLLEDEAARRCGKGPLNP